MGELSKLSRSALSAAMRGGTEGWGVCGSADEHIRYGEPLPRRRGRYRQCHCGCGNRITHRGMANGVTLTCACELGIARWVRTGRVKPAASPSPHEAGTVLSLPTAKAPVGRSFNTEPHEGHDPCSTQKSG